MAQPVKLGQPVNRRLGDLLVADGLLTAEQLKKALAEQRGSPEKIGSVLVRLNYINDEQLIGFLSRQYGVPSITLSS
jgi:type IV pilus assembly protein PilB